MDNLHTAAEDLDIDIDDGPPENPDNYIDDGEKFFEKDSTILYSGNKIEIARLLLSKSKKCAAKYLKEEYLHHQPQLIENTPPDLVSIFIF